MAFTLDTIFSGRPTGQATETGTKTPTASRNGADFAKSLSALGANQGDDDDSDQFYMTDTGHISAAAILVNNPQEANTPPSQDAGETTPVVGDALPTDTLQLAATSQAASADASSEASDTLLPGEPADAPEATPAPGIADTAKTPESEPAQPVAASAEAPIEQLAMPGEASGVPAEASDASDEQAVAGSGSETSAIPANPATQMAASPEALSDNPLVEADASPETLSGDPVAEPVDTPDVQAAQMAAAAPAKTPEIPVDPMATEHGETAEAQSGQAVPGTDTATLAPPSHMPSAGTAAAAPPVSDDADALPDADTEAGAQPVNTDPAIQAALASAVSPVAANAEPKGKDATKAGEVTLTAAPSKAATPADDGGAVKGGKQARKTEQADFPDGDIDQTATDLALAGPDAPADAANTGKTANPQDLAIAAQPNLPQAPVTQAAGTPVPGAMTPTNSLISATPAQVVEIVSDAIDTPEDRKDRVVIQLDPPELGRVSIDFKFDANGLQHVTVTGETPEALRQLRTMHFELVNALERQGLSSQNMSFQQNQTQQDPGQQAARAARFDSDTAAGADQAAPVLVASQNSQTRSATSGGLNIKL